MGNRQLRYQFRVRNHGERGQALLEFAYILPVLLIVLLGVIVFGLALSNYLALTNGASVSARLISISRLQTTDPCSDAVAAFKLAAPNLNAANLKFSFVLNATPYNNVTTCTAGAGNLVQSANAQVTVTYPCNLTVAGINFAPSGCVMTAQTTERVQ